MQEFKANEEEGERAKEAEGSWLGAYIHTILTLKRVLRLGFAPSTPAQLAAEL